jgi:hypothetical protein
MRPLRYTLAKGRMVKITRPLFGDTASGRVGDIGAFRTRNGNAEFIKLAVGNDAHTPKQLQLRACFAAAKTAHAALPSSTRGPWVLFWAQWLIDHPDCLS